MTENTGKTIFSLLDKAARYSAPGPGVTRTLGSAEHKALIPELEQWMKDAGLQTSLDAAGNLIGRYPVHGRSEKTFILGSHQDTVIQGGKYDGMLGIIIPLVVLSRLYREKVKLPFNIELIAFSDEEGVRFPTTLIGSSPLAGKFDMANLKKTDQDGITLEKALVEIGARPHEIPLMARDPEQTAGYLEIHIEQGPVLEKENLPVGIVTAITGIERHNVIVSGQAGHAGTIPMDMRKDALVGASEIVRLVDHVCKTTNDMVGVVGHLSVSPNAVNVVPGRVELTVELRSPISEIRKSGREKVFQGAREKMKKLGLGLEHNLTYSQDEVKCSDRINQSLESAILSLGIKPLRLFSGAGHDGLAMSYLTDIGMLFLRCRKGISHHPDESISMQDAETAAQVLKQFLLNL